MARTCELNDADHVSDPDHVVSKKGFEYCPIKNPCSSSPCPSNQWCAPDFYRDTFKCNYGRLTQWGPWSTCRCPLVRYRGCITPMNTSAPLLCEGSKMEEEKKCKSVTDISGCSGPLGMQDGKIQDNQISASSTYSGPHCYPRYGRLYKTPKSTWDGGWCAKHNRIGEYMQIDLGTMKWVTKIATQGRNAKTNQWVKEYTLSFTNNTITWQDYRGDENCTKRFIGNTDRNTVVTNELPVPVKTRYVRILPQAWSRHISMRMELYGCASVCDGGCKVLDYLDCRKNKIFTGHLIRSFRILAPGLEDCQHKCYLEDKCCSGPLGMQDGTIQDNQISASSRLHSRCDPSNGRLYKTPRLYLDGGWCAKYNRIGEYMQIDLGTMKWVTKIATQGRNTASKQWVKEYTLSFTNDTITWQDYRGDENCTKRFIGNTDINTVVTHELPVPVKTRYVSILPQAWKGRIAMRVELYGCASDYKMEWILLLFTGLTLIKLARGDGGCKVLDYLDCRKNKIFTGHLIRSFRILAPGLEDCQHKCYLKDKCVSYNLGPVEGMARTCELNDADHVSNPDHVVSKKGFEYCPIKNHCSSNPCPSNQWCAPDFYWGTFKCSYGRLTQWGPWSPCRCPLVRYRGCITPMNTSAPLLCEGSKMEEEKKCKTFTDISGCSDPLGMQDGKIQDNQISASSTYHVGYCSPSHGRLYETPNFIWDGGWCAKQNRIGEYMQIDLGTMKWVTKIATQGRNTVSNQWMKEYTLSFTNDTITWQDYRGDKNCTKLIAKTFLNYVIIKLCAQRGAYHLCNPTQLQTHVGKITRFIGNTDINTVVTHELPVPVKTRYVRILPIAWSRHISMRMELYGCTSV
ncbi:uncharacterized protein LOC116297077 [Actinia tenebrosa]|uniref:Uncharacterized protein LOC116297077 n=1 Tax=Actinia tenebrosa TaxID=6105 RepID=A0A6P8I8V7_ACTTE|nr:uncharacterized protein LOC116297077 [Actinia tenebrosa]